MYLKIITVSNCFLVPRMGVKNIQHIQSTTSSAVRADSICLVSVSACFTDAPVGGDKLLCLWDN